MTENQKIIKGIATAFAVILIISIIGGIANALGVLTFLFDGDATGEAKTYELSGDIKAIDIEISAADFSIKESDKFYVESNLKELSVREKNGTLVIKHDKKFSHSYKGAFLTVYLPDKNIFESVKISAGAGKFTADSIFAQKIDMQFGAGEVNIGILAALENANIDGGAGAVTVSDGSLANLDLDMGIGELNISSKFTGKCEFDLGVGESNINILGGKTDYKLSVEKGLGNITVDGEKVSNDQYIGNGINTMDIDGGVGSINVKFK